MGKWPVLGILLLVSLVAGRVPAEEAPVLLADVNRTPGAPLGVSTPEPSGFFRLGDRLLFSTGGRDDEGILWSTDGTAAGTHAISSSTCPAPCNGIQPLGVWRGLGLFKNSSGGDSIGRVRLWRTDGTPAGTYPLTGFLNNDPYYDLLKVTSSPEAAVFYFSSCHRSSFVCNLWRSDGTRAGTSALQDENGALFYRSHDLTFWQGKLYFVAASGEQFGLWSTDGTPGGTAFVMPLVEDYERPSPVRATPSRLFFGAGDASEDLWVIDGIDGTPEGMRRLADLEPSRCYPSPGSYCEPSDLGSMFVLGDEVYFITHRENHGTELWRSDGTESGTRPLIELPNSLDLVVQPVRINRGWLLPVSSFGHFEGLWTANDRSSRAEPLSGCEGGACPVFRAFLHRTDSGAWLFSGSDAVHGDEIWITDGTGAGTRLLADVCPGPCAGYPERYPPRPVFGNLAGRVYFAALSKPGESLFERDELWVTDGTPEGTHRVMEHVTELSILGDRAYFGTGGEEYSSSEIWSTDGTPAETRRVATLRTLAPGSKPSLHPLRDRVVFLADEGDHQSLWTSDGRPSGTSSFFDFKPGFQRRVSGEPWTPAGALWFFQAETGSYSLNQIRIELWRTDGTAQGTGRVATFPRRTSLSLPVAWDGKLLFLVNNPAAGCSFWSSDGTAAGTRQVVPPVEGRRCPTAVAALGSRFVFVARVQGPQGPVPQIFVADGTPAGTLQVSRIRSHREPLVIDDPVTVGGTAFFRIFIPGRPDDAEVWRTDGTPEGTYRAFKLRQPANLYGFRGALYLTASAGSGRGLFRVPLRGGGPPLLLAPIGSYYYSPDAFLPAQFTPLGDRLLFTGLDRSHGTELWVTDGTPGGTRMVRDIHPGPRSSAPDDLLVAGDRIFFSAEDGEHGREPWVSDGTPEGTRLAWDLNPGGFSSLPDLFTVAGGYLFFSADDGETGVEPWSLLIPSPQSGGQR